MRTSVDSLAVDYALNDAYYDQNKDEVARESFKAGFTKCFSLVKPLLEKAIEDFKAEYGDIEEYMYTYEKLEEFLKKI
jgi:hypothetical protein